jgi:hypothetical protein
MDELRVGKVKKGSILKAKDTPSLRWAHVANCGEERKAQKHIQRLYKAFKLRCQEIDKEMASLGKFLEKVKTSSGN